MKIVQYKATDVEPKIQQFWNDHRIIEKIRERNKDGEKFYFLQGPPYTSGKLHLGHAWNHALKDIILRYKRMNGCNIWDRNGYDMHGLPTEHKVMEKHNLRTKEDIEKFGQENFAKECLAFSTEMAGYMDNDLQRLGVTLNYDDPYLPVTNEYMEGCWFLVKRAHENNRLYLGERALQWCAHCETALAKHECEYKEITDDSIFVKFPVKGKENEYLIIWTTTPWTLAFNLAVMVNPTIEYVKAQVGDEKWIVAKVLAAPVIQAVADKQYTILEEYKGIELQGMEYVHPWEKEIPAFKELKERHPQVHTIVLSKEYVTTDAGTGLVHMAPGCGPEDYEVGHQNNIPPFNVVDEQGVFPESMGKFAGWRAKRDDKKFINALGDYLIASTNVDHDYAHCQRCKNPIIFKTTPQWFFRVEDLKEKMLAWNEQVTWEPQAAKHSYRSWLENLRDNSITKQRFWGTPLPIWRCTECGEYDVFGSIAELKKKAKQVPENIHKPWIDRVTYDCPCGGVRKRIPDVLDVWIDAGCASWNCLYYPQRTDLFDEWFPADFILEGKDQIRGWFNLLMVASFLAFDQPSFKRVFMHGFVTDVEGVKMSKSLGNIISPYQVIDKYGADILRYYMCQTSAGQDINFSWDECAIKERYLRVLWNVHRFVLNLAKECGVDPFQLDATAMENLYGMEENYIISLLHSTIKQVTEHMEHYEIDRIIAPIETLYLELSRTYIQMIREKSSEGEESEKKVCLYATAHVMLETLKLFSIVAPFITEMIYQNLRDEFQLEWESIHQYNWPAYDEKKIVPTLEKDVDIAKNVIQAIAGVREKIGRGLRWPLAECIIESTDERVREAVERLSDIIKRQTNIKNLVVRDRFLEVKTHVKSDYAKIGPIYGNLTPKIIAELAVNSSETILNHIEKEGSYDFVVDGQEVSITKDHLIIEREVPAPYMEGDFRGGQVYVNTEATEELDAEGYAREVTRHFQQMRKDAGLEKKDHIRVAVQASEKIVDWIRIFADDIKRKIGAEEFLTNPSSAPSYQHRAVKNVRGEEITLWMEAV
jgi:isoleucyl-tRNA synthetase